MIVMVRDIIENLEKEAKVSRKKKKFILLDPYSLAAFREELGLDIEEDLTSYHGFTIKVQEDESEIIRLI